MLAPVYKRHSSTSPSLRNNANTTAKMSGNHPDAEIHPVATGPAKAVVEAHASAQPLKFYSGWFCPFVQRAWAVLEYKQIPYQYIEINPYHKAPSFLALNPRGLVPTLEFQGKPVIESNVIAELLDEAYADVGPPVRPADLYDRARMRIWIDFVCSRVVPAFHRWLQYQPATPSFEDKGLAAQREEFFGHLKTLTKEMDPTGPFFFGDKPMLIDFVLAPWGLRLWVFDEYKHGLGMPAPGQGGEDEAVWKRWRGWLEGVGGLDCVSKIMSEREHYLPIYQRYADDRAQSEMAKAIRKGQTTV